MSGLRVGHGFDVHRLVAGRPLLEQDSCNGDSDGPFYVMGAAGDWLLAAATSRATDSALNNCGGFDACSSPASSITRSGPA